MMEPMRRVLVGLLAVLVLVPSLAAGNGSVTRVARVWVADRSPFAVRGSGFKAHERVTVTAVAGQRLVRTVKAGRGGAFVVRWSGVSKQGCVLIAIRAVGNRGSVATYKLAGIECPPGPVGPGQ